ARSNQLSLARNCHRRGLLRILVRARGRDVRAEKRMWRHGTRLVLRMELAPEKPRMAFQLHDLHEFSVGRGPGHVESSLLERRYILGIALVAMAVALFDQVDAVCFASERAFLQGARIFSEAHRAAQRLDSNEIAKFEDHLVRRFVIELR